MHWRPRLRFRLATLLLFLTVFCAWLGAVSHRAHKQKEAISRLEQLRADIFFDHHVHTGGYFDPRLPTPGPQWARDLLGDDYFRTPSYIRLKHVYLTEADVAALASLVELKRLDISFCNFSNVRVEPLARLQNLKYLWLHSCVLGNTSLAPLAQLGNLEGLKLTRTEVDDARLPQVARLIRLRELELMDTLVTGASFGDLGRLSRLRDLWISGTSIDDQSLNTIASLPALKLLSLVQTSVTDRGVASLENMRSLEYLRLNGKPIHGGASMLGHLEGLVNLRALVLEITPEESTERSLERLRKTLPKCDIDYAPLGVGILPRVPSRAFPYPGMGVVR